jgi:Sulfotransferase domain
VAGRAGRLGRGVLGSYEAAVDWPARTFYAELMERHPDAKVLLSVRDPEKWYASPRRWNPGGC